MKFLRYLLIGFLAIFIFLAGVWLFAPWRTGGLFALDSVRLLCARNGVYITYTDFSKTGWLIPVYEMRGVNVETPFAKAAMADMTVKLLPLSSILAGGMSCFVQFHDADVTFLPNNTLNLTAGGVKIVSAGDTVKALNTRILGDVQATGDIVYNMPQQNIQKSTLSIKVPANINAMLSSPFLGRYIESPASGEWRIKHNAANE